MYLIHTYVCMSENNKDLKFAICMHAYTCIASKPTHLTNVYIVNYLLIFLLWLGT